MKRHRYEKDADAVCVCGQGRGEEVHNLMVWTKPVGSRNWLAGVVPGLDITYRVRARSGAAAVWWPEFSPIGAEDWNRIGTEIGVPFWRAKEMCEEHRDTWESA